MKASFIFSSQEMEAIWKRTPSEYVSSAGKFNLEPQNANKIETTGMINLWKPLVLNLIRKQIINLTKINDNYLLKLTGCSW